MSTLHAPLVTPRPVLRSLSIDNRLAYLFFAVAYVFGHGLNALTFGGGTVIPGWLSWVMLGLGFIAGTIASTVSAMRAQKSLVGTELITSRMLGMAWVAGFTGLFFVITGLSLSSGDPQLQLLLWPTGSALVVGLIYVAEGAVRRDPLHYSLGTFLTVLGGVALMLPAPLTLLVMAAGGGGAYILAIFLAPRRQYPNYPVL
ncbi:ABC transporter permease [Herbiconiux sp. VKM Ac-1786]|uniref:ABC transporter permease n=1 Tax=Herbiconiux sp. VKM Ac-1786 TaxID=2783824 RepID=UPI00188DB141|nr:ABC transporter permease [Herbiconiux sp. VKM Ac-1786]MBF4571974.1 ABC transporter permease [Herbiconiux sp. VKM Ac-1786]